MSSKTRNASIGVLMLLSVLLAGCSLEVQPIETYTSSNGFLTFRYPMEWTLVEVDPSLPAVLLADDPLGLWSPDDPPGLWSLDNIDMAVTVVPAVYQSIYGSIPDLVLHFFRPEVREGVTVSEATEITLRDGIEAMQFTLPFPEREFTLYLIEVNNDNEGGDDVWITALYAENSHLDNEGLVTKAEDVIRSIRFVGTADEYYNQFENN